MNIETLLSDLKDAITENTAALREVLAVGSAPTVISFPVTEAPKPKGKPKTEKPPVVEPEPVAVVEPEPAVQETHEPEPATEESSAPDPEALIAEITDAWKAQLTAADPARKAELKKVFPDLRAKWGLAADAKLITLAPTPEKLAGLLADIKTL